MDNVALRVAVSDDLRSEAVWLAINRAQLNARPDEIAGRMLELRIKLKPTSCRVQSLQSPGSRKWQGPCMPNDEVRRRLPHDPMSPEVDFPLDSLGTEQHRGLAGPL